MLQGDGGQILEQLDTCPFMFQVYMIAGQVQDLFLLGETDQAAYSIPGWVCVPTPWLQCSVVSLHLDRRIWWSAQKGVKYGPDHRL